MKEVQQIQIQMPTPKRLLTPAVTTMLILMVVGYTLISYAPDFTKYNICISRGLIWELKLWQLITYPFAGSGCGLLFNAFVVLFVGSAVERELKTAGTVLLSLIIISLCGAAWLLANMLIGADFPGGGSHSLAFGLFGAFGVLFRRQRFLFWLWTVEAQTIAWIYIIIGIVLGIASPMYWIWVGGALVAYIYIKAKGKFFAGRAHRTAHFEVRQKSFVDLD